MYSSPKEYIPQVSRDRRPLLMWLLLAAFSLIILGLITGAPVALARGHNSSALAIYAAFSHLCHQIPDRSFFLAGHQFAVCARCTGLYAGFTVATLCYPMCRSLRRTDTPTRKWLFIAAAPLAIDFSLGFFDIWANTHLSRFLTGFLLGAVAVFYVMPGFIELSLRDWRQLLGRKAISLR
ncbi:MAG TPA: DUF2085 domain-containing protein [Pyrinomonadaceae bacterium]|nr:DUF2085 domain-containing protein [Pyrinomonadaceae bacterium]